MQYQTSISDLATVSSYYHEEISPVFKSGYILTFKVGDRLWYSIEHTFYHIKYLEAISSI